MTRVVYPEISGALDPFAGYIAIDTYANIVSGYNSAYEGCTAFATDLNSAIMMLGGVWSVSRMPSRPRIALLGDSIAAQNTLSNSTSAYKYSIGIVSSALAYLGQPWELDVTDNFAVGGTSADVVLSTQIPNLRAAVAAGKRYDRVFISCGTNDTNAGTDVATIQSNLSQVYSAVLALGAIPVQLPILPRGADVSLTTAKKKNLALNAWFEALERSGTIEYPKCAEVFADNAAAYGNALTGTMYDSGTYNLHPNKYGAVLAGKIVADYYTAKGLSFTPSYASQQADKLDRTYNPYGVCFDSANPLLQGGTTAPTGMTTSGGTWSKVSRTLSNGQTRSDCQCVLSASTTHYLYDDAVGSGAWGAAQLQPGDVIEARAWIEITSGVNIEYINLQMTENNGATAIDALDFAQYADGVALPNGNHVLHLRTPKLTVRAYAGSGTASMFARANIKVMAGGSGTAVIKAFEVRRVPS